MKNKYVISRENIFIFLLSIYVYTMVFSESQLVNIVPISTLLFILRQGINILLGLLIAIDIIRIDKKKAYIIFGIVFLECINTIIFSGGQEWIAILLIIVCSRDVNLRKIYRVMIRDLVLGHLIVFLLCKLGILQDIVEYRYIGNYTGSILSGAYYRHSFGFLVHNQIPLAFLIVSFLYVVYRQNRLTIFESVILLILNSIFGIYFGSRITILFEVFLVITYWLIWFWNVLKKSRRLNYRFVMIIYPLMALISFIFSIFYNPHSSFWNSIDMIFNNRLRLANEAMAYYGFSLFGNGKLSTSYSSGVNFTIDNGYISTYIRSGIFVFLLILLIYLLVMYTAIKTRNIYLVVVLVMIAIENLFNTHLFSYKMIPFLCICFSSNPYVLVNENGMRQRWKIKFARLKI